MDLNVLSDLARRTMDGHGLLDWEFSFDRAINRMGACFHHRKKITMSRQLSAVNSESVCMDTLLHEIAHALVGARNGHNHVWQAKAITLGCNPKANVDVSTIADVEKKWLAKCVACDYLVNKKFQRRDYRLCCPKCYKGEKKYNKLAYLPNPRAGQVVLAA